MKGQTVVEKLNEDFDLLSKFKLIQKNIQTPSYAHSVEFDVVTREMMAYEYSLTNQWKTISKFGKCNLNLH